jgi:WXG100 family type VII secretion target
MTPVKITPEDLTTASAQLSTGSQEIHSQLTTLRDTVQALARSDWQGADLSTFGSLCRQWNTAAANLRGGAGPVSYTTSDAADEL